MGFVWANPVRRPIVNVKGDMPMFQACNRKGRSDIALRPIAMMTLGMLLMLSMTGCGGAGASSSQSAVLEGQVVLYPSKPVCVQGESCSAPLANRQVTISTPDKHAAATITTDQQGHFTATLAPGTYIVTVAIKPGLPGMRQMTPGNVTLVAGQTANVTITVDSGIR